MNKKQSSCGILNNLSNISMSIQERRVTACQNARSPMTQQELFIMKIGLEPLKYFAYLGTDADIKI